MHFDFSTFYGKRTQIGIIVLAVAWPVAGLLAGIWIAIQVRIIIDTALGFTVDVSFATISLLCKYPISNFSVHVCHFTILTNVRSLLRPASAAQRTGECMISHILLVWPLGPFAFHLSLAHSSLTEIHFDIRRIFRNKIYLFLPTFLALTSSKDL